jgi:hypothetical protein
MSPAPTVVAFGLAVLTLTACGEPYRLHPPRADELGALDAAGRPLLTSLGYAGPRSRCKVGVVMNDVEGRLLEVGPPTSPESCLVVYATTGVLELPRSELQALFAHALAHLQLGHRAETGRRVFTSAGRDGSMRITQTRPFSATEEAEADRFAVRLLRTVNPGPTGPTCTALTDLFDRLATEQPRWTEWTDQHPVSATRPSEARAACTAELRHPAS